MKKIITLLALTFILTSCFGWETEEIDTGVDVNTVVEEINLDSEINKIEEENKELDEIDDAKIDELIDAILAD